MKSKIPPPTSAEPPLRILAVAGSLNSESVTRVVIGEAAGAIGGARMQKVDLLWTLLQEPLPLYNPGITLTTRRLFPALKLRVDQAGRGGHVRGTPDYHGGHQRRVEKFPGCISGANLRANFSPPSGLARKKVSDRDRPASNRGSAMLRMVAALYGLSFTGDEDVQGRKSGPAKRPWRNATGNDDPRHHHLMAACWRPSVAPIWVGTMNQGFTWRD